MKKKFKFTSLFALGLLLFIACKKETPAPTASFTYTVEGSTVVFTATATDFTKFEWDFGDGSYINTIHNPTHIYSEFGKDFNVSLTIKGEGGEVTVTNVVKIPPMTKIQLLAGGSAATNSKKWRLSPTAASLVVGYADANLTPLGSYPGGILANIGLAIVYGDEFVFKGDGKLTINSKGGGIFSSLAYCMGNSLPMKAYYADAGMAYMESFTAPENATFAINESKNYTISTPLGDVTYANVMTLSFKNDGFLGMKDFTSECMVKKLTASQMDVVIFYAHPQYGAKPMLALQVTFEVAP